MLIEMLVVKGNRLLGRELPPLLEIGCGAALGPSMFSAVVFSLNSELISKEPGKHCSLEVLPGCVVLCNITTQ